MRLSQVILVLVLGVPGVLSAQRAGPGLDSQLFEGLELRSLGPAAVGGRISDIALDPARRSTWYVSTASGGVYKTTNAGTTWQPIFDRGGSYSIGVVVVDPRNSNVVWIGTGENTAQRSVGFGDGVYKSVDAGATWQHMGLPESEHIGKIVFDPRNSDVVYVAAQGPLWRSGGERGLYRTSDGGRSWTRVLHVSDNTGISDVLVNPRNPDELYAASYQRRRHVGLQIAGGPEGAVFKSVDGGRNWRKLENGLPSGNVGRIGLALSPQDPAVVYALVAASGQKGGFFRSGDRGESWVRQSNFVPTDPQYYMELYPDPRQPGRIYTLDVPFRITDDEGKTWRTVGGGGVHVDHHAVAFDPHDPEHIFLGNDGGLYQTFDAGRTWEWFHNLPAAQFYRVDVDNALPFYNVYGGLQDNGSLMSPIRTLTSQGVLNHDWESIGGGDGMQPRAEPNNPEIVYTQSQNGSISRLNRRTGESVSIRPRVAQGAPALRFYWDAPLIVSAHAPRRLYFAAQQLFRSNDRGTNWTAISGDLTRAINRDTMTVMGQRWGADAVGRNLFTSDYGTIVALEESPLQAGLLFVGTDDGLIQISEDDGRTWRRAAALPGVPELAYINDLAASRHDANVLYAVAQNYLRGDFKPYVFRSNDRGRSWTAVRGDLPDRHVAWSIVEDHENRNLLFLGTEFGLFFTVDGGTRWTQLKGGLPTIMMRDLAIQRRENDLVVGTFGRGIYVLDDFSPLRRLTAQVLAEEAVVFPVRDALSFTQRRLLPGATGNALYSADNPPYGALITYHARAGSPLVLQIKDARGELLTEIPAPAGGVRRIAWDLRMQVRDTAAAAGRGRAGGAGEAGEGRGGGRGGGPQFRAVPPGIYTAQLARKTGNAVALLGQPQRITVKALFPAEELGSR